jgi:transposase
MWLTGRLVPDHTTIADFRKDNDAVINKVCARFVKLSGKMGLLAKASLAIDGQQVQGREQSRQLHAGQDPTPPKANRRERGALHEPT